METKNFLIKSSKGKKTILDQAYQKHINVILSTLDEENEARWETYNLIIEQFVLDGKTNCFKEIQYRLTDGENPNTVILDIINRECDDVSDLAWFLKKRLELYLVEDDIKKYYK